MIWILGPQDSELTAIAGLLRMCNQAVYVATQHGRRLSPGDEATGARRLHVDGTLGQERVSRFNLETLVNNGGVVSIGAEGLPGDYMDHQAARKAASANPEDVLPLSTLGQVLSRLARSGAAIPASWDRCGPHVPVDHAGTLIRPTAYSEHWRIWWRTREGTVQVRVPRPVVWEAAVACCLAGAFNGACLGIPRPSEGNRPFLTWVDRLHLRNYVPGLPWQEAKLYLGAVRDELREAPPALDLCPAGFVRDLAAFSKQGSPDDRRFPAMLAVLPLASAMERLGYLISVPGSQGTTELHLGGCGTGSVPGSAPVERWLAGVGEARGCYPAEEAAGRWGLYGDIVQGSAGGVLRGPPARPLNPARLCE
jgi:hypothetical protein